MEYRQKAVQLTAPMHCFIMFLGKTSSHERGFADIQLYIFPLKAIYSAESTILFVSLTKSVTYNN